MREVDPTHFPNVVAALREAGIDPVRELVPVAPAAHYVMGGIATDLDGASTLPGLYAVGECACTGLHGANRLASNSLSECFVFGQRAARRALERAARRAGRAVPSKSAGSAAPRFPRRARRAALWRTRGSSATRKGLRGCSRTRTRSPAWSVPARWPVRRAAARIGGPTPRARTPRSTSATWSSPRGRRRASSTGPDAPSRAP